MNTSGGIPGSDPLELRNRLLSLKMGSAEAQL